MLLWFTLFACKDVVEAPTDLDGLIRFTWSAFDGTEEELDLALTNLQEIADWQGLDEVVDGTVSDLSDEDMALVGLEGKDIAAAAGVYMLNGYSCDFEQLEEILLYAHQDELFDIYNRYERTFVGDESAYRDGTAESVDWRVDYNANVLLEPYDTVLDESIRRVGTETWGDVILLRRAMPEPCVFEDPDTTHFFDQDYTVRTFWERSPGEIVHLYGMWREIDAGVGFSADDEAVQRLLLKALKDLDDDAAQHCLAGVP